MRWLVTGAGGMLGRDTVDALIARGERVTGLGHTLLAAIRTQVYRQSLPLATGNLPIVLGELGPTAGVIGAARLISDHLFSPA